MNLPRNQPLLYLITNRQTFLRKAESDQSASQLQIETIRQAAAAGCQWIQIREKDLGARALAEFTRQSIAVARPHGVKVLVNDRLDVAMAAGADGVHLRVSSLPTKEVRRVVIEKGLQDFLIGVSTHSLSEAKAAEAGGANFIVCGPVYDTPSKREFGEPLGLELFAAICKAVNIPVLALGGINLSNFRDPLEAGAAGIAGIGLFSNPENLLPTVTMILSARTAHHFPAN
ncbi:MAG: thiamine phosphate synthase [Acidobacteria bacterium]|nr:thiamine phosphate synthase [Acidobacteriota bacterium]